MDDEVWNATTFSKNRDRLLRGEIAEEFFAAVLELAREQRVVVGRTFHGGRHDGRRLGQLEKFPAEG
jgi:transposase